MAIRKQNHVLLIFVAVILIVLGFSLAREGKFAKHQEVTPSTTTEPAAKSSGVSANSPASGETLTEAQQTEKQKAFAQIEGDLAECFGYKIGEPNASSPVSLDSLLLQFQSELGPVAHQTDKWVDWHLRTPDGDEKRLRLEISENDDGTIRKELHYYAMGRGDQPVPVELDPSQAVNPSDQVLNDMLREGEVFLKEQAGSVVFPSGERLDYVEKNGDLSEIEFVKGEKFFQCQDLSHREECQCMK